MIEWLVKDSFLETENMAAQTRYPQTRATVHSIEGRIHWP